jgi:hypothetical protein
MMDRLTSVFHSDDQVFEDRPAPKKAVISYTPPESPARAKARADYASHKESSRIYGEKDTDLDRLIDRAISGQRLINNANGFKARQLKELERHQGYNKDMAQDAKARSDSQYGVSK